MRLTVSICVYRNWEWGTQNYVHRFRFSIDFTMSIALYLFDKVMETAARVRCFLFVHFIIHPQLPMSIYVFAYNTITVYSVLYRYS